MPSPQKCTSFKHFLEFHRNALGLYCAQGHVVSLSRGGNSADSAAADVIAATAGGALPDSKLEDTWVRN